MDEIITQERVVMVSHRVISTRRASPRTEKSPTMAPNDKSSDSSICRTCHAAWHRWPHSHVEPIHIGTTSTWKNVASCTHTRNCTECRNETNMWLDEESEHLTWWGEAKDDLKWEKQGLKQNYIENTSLTKIRKHLRGKETANTKCRRRENMR